jgi:hypothetical protein
MDSQFERDGESLITYTLQRTYTLSDCVRHLERCLEKETREEITERLNLKPVGDKPLGLRADYAPGGVLYRKGEELAEPGPTPKRKSRYFGKNRITNETNQ